MAENNNADVKKLNFERALEELESIVKRLEDGKVALEESGLSPREIWSKLFSRLPGMVKTSPASHSVICSRRSTPSS